MEYPIAERFHSVQGEGRYAGVPMDFIRFAGCNVGSGQGIMGLNLPSGGSTLATFGPHHTMCCSALGQFFPCDTDYRKKKVVDVGDLVAWVENCRVCLTGGEPLLHDLWPLFCAFSESGHLLHLETSGTLPIPDFFAEAGWVTCSPKRGFLSANAPFIDEWKFVVGLELEPEAQAQRILELTQGNKSKPIYLQPLDWNATAEIARHQRDVLLSVLRLMPQDRFVAVGLQLHKYLGLP